jgi:hypothetical protein
VEVETMSTPELQLYQRHVDVLQRRLDWLDGRITKGEGDGFERSFDKQERSALVRVLALIEHVTGMVPRKDKP